MIRTLFAILLSLNVLSASAEPERRGPPPGPPPFTEVAAALALTEAQIAPVKAIFDIQHEQMRALDAPNRERHEQIRAATQASLAAILSPEQMQKLLMFNASHRPPPPPDAGPDGNGASGRRPPPQQQ